MDARRLQMEHVAPDGYRAVRALEAYTRRRVDRRLLMLVKVRASILNGCSYCADLHASEALSTGEDVRRLMGVATYSASPLFTAGEKTALALTDAVTSLDRCGVPDDLWAEAVAAFGDEGTADLVLAIAAINVWNRVAVSTGMTPPVAASSR